MIPTRWSWRIFIPLNPVWDKNRQSSYPFWKMILARGLQAASIRRLKAVAAASGIRRWRPTVRGHQDHLVVLAVVVVAVLIPVCQRTTKMGVKLYVIIEGGLGLRGQWRPSLLLVLLLRPKKAFIIVVAVPNNLIGALGPDLFPVEFSKVNRYQ